MGLIPMARTKGARNLATMDQLAYLDGLRKKYNCCPMEILTMITAGFGEFAKADMNLRASCASQLAQYQFKKLPTMTDTGNAPTQIKLTFEDDFYDSQAAIGGSLVAQSSVIDGATGAIIQ
jgi:hypothetical protein